MTGERPRQGMLDTNVVILRKWVDPAELPDEMAISAITVAELSAGPHEVRGNDEQNAYDEHAERARRWRCYSELRASSTPCRLTPRLLACSGG
jgi:predicted nucleic acid-binding protein